LKKRTKKLLSVSGGTEFTCLGSVLAQAALSQPPGCTTRCVDAGCTASIAAGRIGRGTRSPPQLGQMPCSTVAAQAAQNVHS
jgi:hypothetical protein